MTAFYHLCFVVADLERATADLTRTVGVQWSPVRAGRLGDWDYCITFSLDGPPFLEVIQGPPGSPWDATAGPRFDHLGYWAADLEADQHHLTEHGAPPDFDACPYGSRFSYHHLDSIGARIELVDIAGQAGFLDTWNVDGPPMPPLRRPHPDHDQ